MLSAIQTAGRAGFNFLRRLLALGFEPAVSPLRHLGALTIFFFWIVLVSGIWLFFFFHTSVHGAYESVEYLTNEQWYLGGVMRSLHRYASDAAIVTIALHMVKEFVLDRYRSKRWFSWITGMPLIWLVIPLGITGYWLVWDDLALFVAISSAELLDWLPIFTGSMARNFLSADSLSDRFFTLMAFLHLIGLPLFLVLGIWLHVFRMSRPRINPPRQLMIGALVAMTVLSLLYPATSQGPADPTVVPDSVGLDWFYLTVYPLIGAWSPGAVWALLLGLTVLICLAPWLPPSAKIPVARVDLDNCNGCGRCVDDCPFSAVSLAPRSDGKAYAFEAAVDPDLCVSCGICVGACPTAMPFRTRTALIPGIDMPDQTMSELRDEIDAAAARPGQHPRILSLCCRGSRAARDLRKAGREVVEVRCMAHVPPPFIDYVLNRDLADGVFLAGCTGGDCEYRFGDTWTQQRVERQRDPRLRERADRRRVALGWLAPWCDNADTGASVAAFARTLSPQAEDAPVSRGAGKLTRRVAMVAGFYTLFFAVVAWLSASPHWRLIEHGDAIVSLSFTHAGQLREGCRTLSEEELAELPPNMRVPTDCPRGRLPVRVELRIDGETLYSETLAPTGFMDDGEATVYRRFGVPHGSHRLFVGMSDSHREQGFDYRHETDIVLNENQHMLIDFDHARGEFVLK